MNQPITETPRADVPDKEAWFGHPRGLATLFFTEMWERFSYYGMRGILILFMAAPLMEGGLAFDDRKAAAIYGLYTSMVYLLALPGGWVADKIWGQRKAVFVGGCIIAAGHFSMALPMFGLPEQGFFFLGLVLIVVGTGLLKPNVSTMVGDLYPESGARRDAGFSIFYMGINVGAFAGPLVCGWLGEDISWHLGFSAAGFGMVLGLIQYKLGARHLGRAGLLSTGEETLVVNRRQRNFYLVATGVALATLALVYLTTSGVIETTLSDFAFWVGIGIVLLTILYFAYLTLGTPWAGGILVASVAAMVYFTGQSGQEWGGQMGVAVALGMFVLLNAFQGLANRETFTLERRRLLVIFWLFLLAAVFWSGFEQAGSSMNLFAERDTDRMFFGWQMPASWLQSINPIFIILLAPVFGSLWVWLDRRNANPSIPVKFALGILGLAGGFFVLAWGAANTGNGNLVSPAWLVVTYFLHTCGELALSPVGLSSITKLAPKGRVGQMMGIWFIGAALGNLFAGLVAGQLEDLPAQALFSNVAMGVGAVGLVALLFSPGVKRLMGEVE